MELTDKAKSLLAKRGFDPVLGARPLRRTIQREIEDAAVARRSSSRRSDPGQLVTVDVDNWDGEGAGEDAVFTFTGTTKPAKGASRTWRRPERTARRARLHGVASQQKRAVTFAGAARCECRAPIQPSRDSR